MTLTWSIGLTTVPERRETTLPRTLASLQASGWEKPHLFVDDAYDEKHWWYCLGCSLTFRNPRIGAFGNWYLALIELHLREPNADRYLMVQDDVIFSKNVRQLFDKTLESRMPTIKQWFNLYTVDNNESVIAGKPTGWYEAAPLIGQGGNHRQVNKGALALVFSNQAVEALLGHPTIISKCRSGRPRTNIDGSVGAAMNAMGWREMIHNPSLCDHTGGDCSIIDSQIEEEVKNHKRGSLRGVLPKCQSFKGEQWDAMELLK